MDLLLYLNIDSRKDMEEELQEKEDLEENSIQYVQDCSKEMEDDDHMTWEDGSFWQHMPDDLIIHIFSFLDCNSLLEASKTCKNWRRVTADESLWKDLISCKVGKPRTSLPQCDSWYQEYRRLCMNVPYVESESLKEHTDEIYHVMFSPSGKYFSTTGKDGLVVVWELGTPTTVFAVDSVVEVPSYTRYSEFNQSETKLLVAGIDVGYFFDGFVKIYKFAKELISLCVVRVEFPNFRGSWFNDDYFITMVRTSDDRNGYYLQVRAHCADRSVYQIHSYSELTKIKNNQHRNDFVRVVDKTKWPTEVNHPDVSTQEVDMNCSKCKDVCCCDNGPSNPQDGPSSSSEDQHQCCKQDGPSSSSVDQHQCCKQDGPSSSSVDQHQCCKQDGPSSSSASPPQCDKSILIHQTSTVNYSASLFQYHINNDSFKEAKAIINFNENHDELFEEEEEGAGFTLPQTVYNSECTVIGTNLSSDHRYFVFSVRPKVIVDRNKEYSASIETRVYDLMNDRDTGEMYMGAKAVGTDHVSYIFPTISQNYVASGSENLKGYIWDRKYGNVLSVLNHDCGVHSQNGVNCTAFCPSDEEVLVTVADDLIVRIWRSRQRLLDSRIASVVSCSVDMKENPLGSGASGEHCPEHSLEEETEDHVTCCYGLRQKQRMKKKS